jgi:type III secretory pathway component EscS
VSTLLAVFAAFVIGMLVGAVLAVASIFDERP